MEENDKYTERDVSISKEMIKRFEQSRKAFI